MSALRNQVGGNHYAVPIQPVEFIHANGLGFCAGNIVKYATRYRDKGGADDIRKIIHYAELLLELEYGEARAAIRAGDLSDADIEAIRRARPGRIERREGDHGA